MIGQQVPAPPPVPDVPPLPIEVFHGPGAWVPIMGMLTGVLIAGMFLLGPVGRAIGQAIRHWLGGGRQEARPPSGELDDVHGRLDQLQRQVAELAERQDFAERLLAMARREKALPGGSDVPR